MPFDGLTLTKSLAQALQNAGFTPIDEAVLDAHKRAQLQRYPGSWGYHHLKHIHAAMAVTAFSLMFIALVSGATLVVGVFAYLLVDDYASMFKSILLISGMTFCGSMLLLVLLVQMEDIHITRPANWSEQALSLKQMRARNWFAAPAQVRDLMETIADQHSHRTLQFIYGELSQGVVVLDPYFCMVDLRTHEKVILAIWDDDTILHIA